MTRLIRAAALASFTLCVPGLAEAHTGVHLVAADGAAAGFAHPFLGADHLLAMVAVGLWAASLGGRARWLVPASFVALMTLGAALGADGVALPAVEPMVALSVIALGALVALSLRVPTIAAAALVALFGLFHGAAHGAEMPALASPLAYGLGFIAATALLHGVGLALGGLRAHAPLRLAGGAIAAAGVALALPL
ncbi:MAG: HupE/UreJ family protein [Rhodopseudomonas palustris]|uniref:HupE/UreJ family protein n=1 Tax=Rhodopseudomonas palustris TaxID=1076 RepID=A0A933VX26_RHOPL|nr:HupE/UreJ family protein [Rhodopseudomonas palustris]